MALVRCGFHFHAKVGIGRRLSLDYFDYRSQKMEGAKVMTESSAQLGSRHLLQSFAAPSSRLMDPIWNWKKSDGMLQVCGLLEPKAFEGNKPLHPILGLPIVSILRYPQIVPNLYCNFHES